MSDSDLARMSSDLNGLNRKSNPKPGWETSYRRRTDEDKQQEIIKLRRELAQIKSESSSPPPSGSCVVYYEPTIDSEIGQVIYHGSLTMGKTATALSTFALAMGQFAEALDEGHKTYHSGKEVIGPMLKQFGERS